MPRQPRLELPGVPLHVTQRGVNRCATFLVDDDHIHYLHLLREKSGKLRVKVHAYVLMDFHVHLGISVRTKIFFAGFVAITMFFGSAYAGVSPSRQDKVQEETLSKYKDGSPQGKERAERVVAYMNANPLFRAFVFDLASSQLREKDAEERGRR